MQINCPHCGPRSVSEFSYGGDATLKRPTEYTEEAFELWMDYVYYRANPRGWHNEYWHHQGGCRAWLKLERHTVSHEIRKVHALIEQQKGGEER